ncbi:MAG: hypothetical protein EBR09_16685 [Proteobacteria bacterium]|jgi:hypothetical protein|nr:hypothetical protein [Pseudomonadota bacterium]
MDDSRARTGAAAAAAAAAARFPWSDLPGDLQELIRGHTATVAAVEADVAMRLRFAGEGWTDVPYVIRYELRLAPRDLRAGPEMEVTLRRFLQPAFARSRRFRESDAAMQELLVSNAKEITFSGVCAARAEVRDNGAGQAEFIQFVARRDGAERAWRTPFWGRVERGALDAVRARVAAMCGGEGARQLSI